jgi:hypothetical protein
VRQIRIIAGLALLFTSFLTQANPVRYDLTGHISGVDGNLTHFKVGDSFSGWFQFDWDVIYNTSPDVEGFFERYQNAAAYKFNFTGYAIFSYVNVNTMLWIDRPKELDGTYTVWDVIDDAPGTYNPNTFIEELRLDSNAFSFDYWESNAIYLNFTNVWGKIDSIGQSYTVPEPSSITLLLLGLIGIYPLRKKGFFPRKQQ